MKIAIVVAVVGLMAGVVLVVRSLLGSGLVICIEAEDRHD